MGGQQNNRRQNRGQRIKCCLWLACIAVIVVVAITILKHIESAGEESSSDDGLSSTSSITEDENEMSSEDSSDMGGFPLQFEGTVEDAIEAATDEIEDIIINERRLGVGTNSQNSSKLSIPRYSTHFDSPFSSQSLSDLSSMIALEVATAASIYPSRETMGCDYPWEDCKTLVHTIRLTLAGQTVGYWQQSRR